MSVDMERVEVLESRTQAVGLIAVGIAAQSGDVEGSVVEQILELTRQIRAVLSDAPQRASGEGPGSKRL